MEQDYNANVKVFLLFAQMKTTLSQKYTPLESLNQTGGGEEAFLGVSRPVVSWTQGLGQE